MGWSYPDISIEDLMKLIKNFIDMMILASGYQSTGHLANWDPDNIKRSFQWALFLQNVSKGLLSSADYEDSVKELDALLYELTLDSKFPQDLAQLSCITLGRAADLMLEHLMHTFPLRESHLNNIITAIIEMDVSKLKRIENKGLDVYLEKIMLNVSTNFGQNPNISTQDVPSEEHDDWVDGYFSMTTIQQLGKRRLAVSSSSAVEVGLENIWHTIRQKMLDELGSTSNSEPLMHSTIGEELPLESALWNCWRTRSLSYMLDKRTMRMISGASLIYSAPESQWTQMLERLDIPVGSDDYCEMIGTNTMPIEADLTEYHDLPVPQFSLSSLIELLLLGCVADRWSSLLGQLMSVSYEFPTMSRLYHEVFSLPLRKSPDPFLNEGLMNAKEKNVLDYLEVFLSSKVEQLWKLSPVLAAVAIPSWSKLFRFYIRELEDQLIGNSLVRWLREYGVSIFFISGDPMLEQRDPLFHDCAAHLLHWGNKLNRTSLEKWMQKSKAPALDHILRLFHEIKTKGFKISLISTRRESLRDATADNLIKEGYHGWSGLVLRNPEEENKPVVNY